MGLRFARRIACALVLSFAASILSALPDAARAAAPLPASASDAAPGKSSSLSAQKRTRFIIALEHRTTYQVFSLSNPNRVVVELPAVRIRLPELPENGPVGLVSGFRGGRAGSEKSKVIIRVTEPVFVEKAKLEMKDGKDPQLVLDIVSLASAPPVPVIEMASASAPERPEPDFDKPFKLGAAGLLPRPPQPAQRPEELAKRTAKQLIVIDPGHGGHDSGARKNGIVEKDVVLEFSHTLRKKLEATGRYRVLMTREDDRFIPLGDRTEFAEEHNASLFLSVHADYARSSARGGTIYSLRPSAAKRLKKRARARASDLDIPDSKFAAIDESDSEIVKKMLADRASAAIEVTYERTDLLSRSVVDFMGEATNLRSDPHKTAGFKVLKSALVPAILIELAYVTNKRDAKQLKSESWRQEVAGSITEAVDSYFATNIARIPM